MLFIIMTIITTCKGSVLVINFSKLAFFEHIDKTFGNNSVTLYQYS